MSTALQTAHQIYNDYGLDSLPNDVKEQLIILFSEKQTVESSAKHSLKYTDQELEELLTDYPLLCEDDIIEVSDQDYKDMVKNMHNKPNINIERWL